MFHPYIDRMILKFSEGISRNNDFLQSLEARISAIFIGFILELTTYHHFILGCLISRMCPSSRPSTNNGDYNANKNIINVTNTILYQNQLSSRKHPLSFVRMATMSHMLFLKPVDISWWRHQTETFSVSLALCDGNPSLTGGFPSQRSVTRSVDVLFDLRLDKLFSKQSRRRWFETPLRSIWCHCNYQCFSYWYIHLVIPATATTVI